MKIITHFWLLYHHFLSILFLSILFGLGLHLTRYLVPDPAPSHESVLILQSAWIGVEKCGDHSVVTGRGEEEPVGQNGDDKRTSLASSSSSRCPGSSSLSSVPFSSVTDMSSSCISTVRSIISDSSLLRISLCDQRRAVI